MSTISAYTGDGSTTQFDITFSYRDAATVKASLDGVETEAFTFVNPSRIEFDDAPANGAEIKIFRRTSVSAPDVTFADGAIVRGEDLNAAVAQPRDRVEEIESDVNAITGSALKAPVGETLATLPPAAERADHYLAFGSGGVPVLVTPPGADLPLRTELATLGDGLGAELVRVDPGIAEAAAQTVQSMLSAMPINVKMFGAMGDAVRDVSGVVISGTDDTAAIQAAIDVVTSLGTAYTSIFLPPGSYLITDTLRLDKNKIRFYGAGDKSVLVFKPTSDKEMLLVQNSNPASLINYISLETFGVVADYSAPTQGYAKTAIKLIDASSVTIQNINILDQSWVGGAGLGSIGIHFAGRDTHNVHFNTINADQPIYADVNPNSTQYQFDGHNFEGNWLNTLKPSNYAIRFAAGVNPSNWIMVGNTNAYQGKGGIWLDNSSVSGMPYPASMIKISMFRIESGPGSGGDAGGYGIYMDFGDDNPACGNIEVSHSSVNDPAVNGYHFNNVTALELKHVNCGFGANDALVLSLVRNAYIKSLGIGSPLATVTFNDMYARHLTRLANAAPGDKSIADAEFVYYASDTPASNLTYRNGVREWSRTERLANAGEIDLPFVDTGEIMLVQVVSGAGIGWYTATHGSVSVAPGSDSGYGIGGGGSASVSNDGAGGNKLVNVSLGSGFPFIVNTWVSA